MFEYGRSNSMLARSNARRERAGLATKVLILSFDLWNPSWFKEGFTTISPPLPAAGRTAPRKIVFPCHECQHQSQNVLHAQSLVLVYRATSEAGAPTTAER